MNKKNFYKFKIEVRGFTKTLGSQEQFVRIEYDNYNRTCQLRFLGSNTMKPLKCQLGQIGNYVKTYRNKLKKSST